MERGGLGASIGGGGEAKGWFGKGEMLGGWERRELLKGVVLILGKCFCFLFSFLSCMHAWLSEALPVMLAHSLNWVADAVDVGKFRDLQRLTVQYARILGLTADGEDEENDDDDGGGGENGAAAEKMELEE